MKLLTKTLVVAALAFVAGFTVATLNTAPVMAHEGEDHSEEVAQTEGENNEEQAEEAKTYTFTAQSGDSYSLIARKSIQIFGYDNQKSLSEAQIIAAETWLTQEAGSPELNEGQEVALGSGSINSAVEKALALSDEQEALWQPYADSADFNTNNVGE